MMLSAYMKLHFFSRGGSEPQGIIFFIPFSFLRVFASLREVKREARSFFFDQTPSKNYRGGWAVLLFQDMIKNITCYFMDKA